MITKIVIHCSDSSDGQADIDAAEIHRWHQERGFDGIGYHYVIKRDGIVENGRPHYWEGAHVSGHNAGSIGVCLVGRDEFTEEQFNAMKSVLYLLKFKYQDAEVMGHYELDHRKTCPNFSVKAWVELNMPGIEHTVRH